MDGATDLSFKVNFQFMIRRRSVALLVETSNAYSRGLLDGVIDYMRHHEAWSISLPEQERGARPPKWLSRWRGDGIIARIETEQIARAVKRKKLPVVDVSAARHVPKIPWVETDDLAVAQLAAEHLLGRGFKHLAFCGDAGFNWSVWRGQHFENIVRDAGAKCHVHESKSRWDSSYSWNREKRRLATWLERLPRPVGIMACYDIKAQQVLDVCRELEIAVPEEAAVIGVDNDRLLCDLADPPLSSVICNTHRTGYEAASLLDRMMSGEPVPPEAHLIKPQGIETRQSTDILAIEDPHVAVAARFIREQACAGIQVTDVLQYVPYSRRVLDRRFLDSLGRTPHEEIARQRIDRVKQLLVETDLPLSVIASRVGFQHDEYMSVAFKKQVGQPPSNYRRSAGEHS